MSLRKNRFSGLSISDECSGGSICPQFPDISKLNSPSRQRTHFHAPPPSCMAATVDAMKMLNTEAQLPSGVINLTSCELRLASANLRKSIIAKNPSRMLYGLHDYQSNI
jgi:hypothetical protein